MGSDIYFNIFLFLLSKTRLLFDEMYLSIIVHGHGARENMQLRPLHHRIRSLMCQLWYTKRHIWPQHLLCGSFLSNKILSGIWDFAPGFCRSFHFLTMARLALLQCAHSMYLAILCIHCLVDSGNRAVSMSLYFIQLIWLSIFVVIPFVIVQPFNSFWLMKCGLATHKWHAHSSLCFWVKMGEKSNYYFCETTGIAKWNEIKWRFGQFCVIYRPIRHFIRSQLFGEFLPSNRIFHYFILQI